MPAKPRTAREIEVGSAVEALGMHLREARLRREVSIEEVAEKIGVTRQTVAEAEHGKATTSIGVYAGMLWALGLVSQLENLATQQMEPDDELAATEARRKRAPRRAPRKTFGRQAPDPDIPF